MSSEHQSTAVSDSNLDFLIFKVAYSSTPIIPPDYWTYQAKTNKINRGIMLARTVYTQYIDLRGYFTSQY